MKKHEFAELAQKSKMPMSTFGDLYLAMILKVPADKIYWSNNLKALSDEIKEMFIKYASVKKLDHTLLEVQILSDGLITTNEFICINGELLNKSFNNNLLENAEKGKIENPRLIVVYNFERLSDNVQRSLLIDVVGSYPNSLEYCPLGFSRTKKDSLIMAIDVSMAKPQISRNVTSRCSNMFMYSKKRAKKLANL